MANSKKPKKFSFSKELQDQFKAAMEAAPKDHNNWVPAEKAADLLKNRIQIKGRGIWIKWRF